MTTTDLQTAVSYLSRRDPVLKPLIDTVAPLAFDSSGDVYYDLVSCVADQQIHYRVRTWQAFARLLDLFPGGYPPPTAPDILTNALNSNLTAGNYNSLIRTYAYYVQADVQAYNQLFLMLTGRNESASTFGAMTYSSFFFPSAALAWQFSKLPYWKAVRC